MSKRPTNAITSASDYSVVSTAQLLDSTALLERQLFLGCCLFFVLLCAHALVRGRRQRLTAAPADGLEAALTPAREASCLALILLAALLTRTLGWDQPINAPHWFSQATPLYVAEALQHGHLWEQWLKLLQTFQLTRPHESAVMMPVATAFQIVLGPSIHLPVLVGAFWGVLSIFLAWLVGRTFCGHLFGLLFAAFLTASPLHLTWSRIGGIPIGAVAHVLLVLYCGYRAGARQSMAWALVTGLVAWASLYQYYAARVAIPLSALVLWAGLRRSRASALRTVAVLACLIVTLCALYMVLSGLTNQTILWPRYAGYTGNKGERNLIEIFTSNFDSWSRELHNTPVKYFLRHRTAMVPAGTPFTWGAQFGGLCFAPVGALGCIGLVYALLRFKREYPWLLLTATGFALPFLSFSTARRFLIFDLAWCALASHGVLAVLASRIWRGVPRAVVGIFLGLFLLGLTAWSFGTMLLLNARLPGSYGASLPFGESGFADGLTCLRCLRAGHEWQSEIERNAFVVLFDTDEQRENRTSPGGLPLYGKLGALAGGRAHNFIDFYSVMQNFDREPPLGGQFLYPQGTDSASYLIARITEAAPATIIWHFEQPTQWEHWLAARLEAAGGVLERFTTPLSDTRGLRVRTSWKDREQAFAVIRRLSDTELADDADRLGMQKITVLPGQPPLVDLTPVDTTSAPGIPTWAVISPFLVAYGAHQFPHAYAVGLAIDRGGPGDPEVLRILTRTGQEIVRQIPLGEPARSSQVRPGPVGFDCAAWIASRWWVVDPVAGVVGNNGDVSWLPRAPWVGIARGPGQEVVLASADQYLHVFDVAEQREIRRFPARVWPSRRVWFGDCSPIVAGDGWYATLNHMTSLLTVYNRNGELVGSTRLDRVVGFGPHRVHALAATGPYLGVIGLLDTSLTVLRITLAGS